MNKDNLLNLISNDFFYHKFVIVLILSLSGFGAWCQNSELEYIEANFEGGISVSGDIEDLEGNTLSNVPAYIEVFDFIDAGVEVNLLTTSTQTLSSPFSYSAKDAHTLSITLGSDGDLIYDEYFPRTYIFGYDMKESATRETAGTLYFENQQLVVAPYTEFARLKPFIIGLSLDPNAKRKIYSVTNLETGESPTREISLLSSDDWTTGPLALALEFDKTLGESYPLLDPFGRHAISSHGHVKISTNDPYGGFLLQQTDNDPYLRKTSMQEAPQSGYTPSLTLDSSALSELLSGRILQLYFFCYLDGYYGKGSVDAYFVNDDQSVGVKLRLFIQPNGSRNLTTDY